MTMDQSAVGNGESMEQLREKCVEIVDRVLTRQEGRVLKLRLGLEDGQTRSLEEVAAQLGMTREQARLIEASALRRLRRPSGPCAKRVIDSFAEVQDPDEGIRRDG